MKIFNLFKKQKRAVNGSALYGFGGASATAAGVHVDAETALRFSAVFRAVAIISQTIASLPVAVNEKSGDDTVKRALNHPLHRVLNRRPCAWLTSNQARYMAQASLLLRGNAYFEKRWNNTGRLEALIPIHPDRVNPVLVNEVKAYEVRDPRGQKQIFSDEKILHLWQWSNDGGVKGLSVLQYAKEAIAAGLAAEEHGARFFSQGTVLAGTLTHPAALSESAADRLREAWRKKYSGATNAHNVLILEEGMKWEPLGMSAEDAQFIESRQFQVTDIARFFGVPPHMLGDLTRATFSNIEQQSIEFVQHCVRPWIVCWEQLLEHGLLMDNEIDRYEIKFKVEGLLRGDIKSRFEAYAVGRQNGWLSANDIRRLEDMNPIPEDQNGDIYLVPLNMVPSDKAGEVDNDPPSSAPPAEDPPADDSRAAISPAVAEELTAAVKELAARAIRKQQRMLEAGHKNAARGAEFNLNKFYAEQIDLWEETLNPAAAAARAVISAIDPSLDLSGIETTLASEIESFTAKLAKETERDGVIAVAQRLDSYRGEYSQSFAAEVVNKITNKYLTGLI